MAPASGLEWGQGRAGGHWGPGSTRTTLLTSPPRTPVHQPTCLCSPTCSHARLVLFIQCMLAVACHVLGPGAGRTSESLSSWMGKWLSKACNREGHPDGSTGLEPSAFWTATGLRALFLPPGYPQPDNSTPQTPQPRSSHKPSPGASHSWPSHGCGPCLDPRHCPCVSPNHGPCPSPSPPLS